VLIGSPEITVTSTRIYILFNPEEVEVPSFAAMINTVFVPGYDKLRSSDTDLNQEISVLNGTISSIRIYVVEHDTNSSLYDSTISSGVSTDYTNSITIATDLSSWDENYAITVAVVVTDSDGNTWDFNKTYRAYIAGRPMDIVLGLLRDGLKADFGCEDGKPCGILIIISLFITMALCASLVVATPLRNPVGIIAIATISLGFFTFLEWIDLYWYIFFIFIGFAGLATTWRLT